MSSLSFSAACPLGASLGGFFSAETLVAMQCAEFWHYALRREHFEVNFPAVLHCARLRFMKPGLQCCKAEQLWVSAVPK